jgi:hypothetical protein
MIMSCIYSFSGLPFLLNGGDRFTGGFNSKELFIQCAEESIDGARKTFKKITLYVDFSGKEILKDLLYKFDDIVEVEVPEWSGYFFSYIKFLAFIEQLEPFIHLDLDFVINERLPDDILEKNIIVQFQEEFRLYKYRAYDYITQVENPDKIIYDYLMKGAYNPSAYCVGIFGGADLDFIKRYSKDVLRLAKQVKDSTLIKNLNTVLFLEQGYLSIKVQHEKKNVFLFHFSGIDFIHYIGTEKKNYNIINNL